MNPGTDQNQGEPHTSPAFLVAIGVAAQTVQILLLRELMSLSYGTEVAAAVLLGVWLAGGAVGSAAARRGKPWIYATILAAVILPALAFVRISRDILSVGSGEAVALSKLCILTLATSFPIAALAGAAFAVAARRAADPGRAYAVEAAGAGAAGLLLVILLPLVNPFSLALAGAALPLLAAMRRNGRIAGAAVLAGLVFLGPVVDRATREAYWRTFSNEKFTLVETIDSPYGPLAAVEYREQFSIYHSGRLLFSLPDRGEAAPPVHVALLRHPAPERVLLVGGGIGGALRAALRHPLRDIDYVEIDPDILSISTPHAKDSGMDDPRVRLHVDDGRSFVRASPAARYDVLLVLTGTPATLAGNRYFTSGFFAEARRILSDDGVLLIGPIASHTTYAGSRYITRNGLLLRTIRERFPDAAATAGSATFFVCGGDDRVEERLMDRGITDVDIFSMLEPFAVEKVNFELLTGEPFDPLADERPEPRTDAPLNTDARPLAVLRTAALQAALVRDPAASILDAAETVSPLWVVVPLVAVALLFFFRRKGATGLAVFAAGLFGSGALLIAMAAFQSAFGALYLGVAAIFGLFMTGLAVGAGFGNRLRLELSLAGAAAVSVLSALLFHAPFLPLHCLAVALCGACVGAAFPAALRRAGREKVGRLYAIDLAGGMAGALIFAPLALPLWGAMTAALILAGACVLAIPCVIRAAPVG